MRALGDGRWLQILLLHLSDHLEGFLGHLGLVESVDESIGGESVAADLAAASS